MSISIENFNVFSILCLGALTYFFVFIWLIFFMVKSGGKNLKEGLIGLILFSSLVIVNIPCMLWATTSFLNDYKNDYNQMWMLIFSLSYNFVVGLVAAGFLQGNIRHDFRKDVSEEKIKKVNKRMLYISYIIIIFHIPIYYVVWKMWELYVLRS